MNDSGAKRRLTCGCVWNTVEVAEESSPRDSTSRSPGSRRRKFGAFMRLPGATRSFDAETTEDATRRRSKKGRKNFFSHVRALSMGHYHALRRQEEVSLEVQSRSGAVAKSESHLPWSLSSSSSRHRPEYAAAEFPPGGRGSGRASGEYGHPPRSSGDRALSGDYGSTSGGSVDYALFDGPTTEIHVFDVDGTEDIEVFEDDQEV